MTKLSKKQYRNSYTAKISQENIIVHSIKDLT